MDPMISPEKVAVALSGGVDSAVAAALLRDQGWEVLGVHLRLLSGGPSPDHLKSLTDRLGIPLLELDLKEDFTRGVVDYFVAEYLRGRTPSPCVRCNAAIKFGVLWERLRARGIRYLATGHYARLQRTPQGDWGLYRGADRHKDQSYFLARLPRVLLPQLLFPLGDMLKSQVRTRCRDLGLPLEPGSRESMDLCFISQGGYREFLREQLGGRHDPPGELVDTRGRVLGRHRGLTCYTVGQRRGLGTPSSEPYYVAEILPETNRVVLGRRQDLLSSGLLALRVNWLIDPPPGEWEADTVIRYRHPGVQARLLPLDQDRVQVSFAIPQAAVAPGQAVAFYQGNRLLGGGWIEERIK